MNATGARASDRRALPLCHTHHTALHLWRGGGGERGYWRSIAIDPETVLEELNERSPVKDK